MGKERSPPLWEGMRVELHGLNAAGLNGSIGVCGAVDRNNGRYTIELQGGKLVAIKPANLRAAPEGDTSDDEDEVRVYATAKKTKAQKKMEKKLQKKGFIVQEKEEDEESDESTSDSHEVETTTAGFAAFGALESEEDDLSEPEEEEEEVKEEVVKTKKNKKNKKKKPLVEKDEFAFLEEKEFFSPPPASAPAPTADSDASSQSSSSSTGASPVLTPTAPSTQTTDGLSAQQLAALIAAVPTSKTAKEVKVTDVFDNTQLAKKDEIFNVVKGRQGVKDGGRNQSNSKTGVIGNRSDHTAGAKARIKP